MPSYLQRLDTATATRLPWPISDDADLGMLWQANCPGERPGWATSTRHGSSSRQGATLRVPSSIPVSPVCGFSPSRPWHCHIRLVSEREAGDVPWALPQAQARSGPRLATSVPRAPLKRVNGGPWSSPGRTAVWQVISGFSGTGLGLGKRWVWRWSYCQPPPVRRGEGRTEASPRPSLGGAPGAQQHPLQGQKRP